MGKPAELGALVKRQQASTSQLPPEPQETPAPPNPRIARPKPDPELVRRDIGPPRKLSFNCPADVYLALKIHSAHSGELHQDIIARALSEWLAKHGMRG